MRTCVSLKLHRDQHELAVHRSAVHEGRRSVEVAVPLDDKNLFSWRQITISGVDEPGR